ncbi:hypothetical protein MTR_1g052130 [Medicago truncatula]|uniref:Uncharacterized protein n=1 Tax=Medicago truncatula TaxID=3880 RepID=A0A072VIV6_MEDTR|nr:hypothetical protein MTR_1g052130 [Medicago truncatula]
MAQKPREYPLSNSEMRNSSFYIFQLMLIHEGSGLIYSNPRGQIVVEIVIIINTSMETQSSKNRYCQTWWLVGLIVNSRVVKLES